jgi:hypothetical protein
MLTVVVAQVQQSLCRVLDGQRYRPDAMGGAPILPAVAGAEHGVAPAGVGPIAEIMVARRCCSAAASSRNLLRWSWVACRAGAGFAPVTATFGVLPGAARAVGDLVRRATEHCLPPRR